ncbi:hypothetical protein BLNAU_13381 [Blattamonas nauphoetae]|uniref:Uncharacterized protein n=1 Tax=Blattamonas nauphoetae TaxID=2049346 RepID=A0ABQ9XLZ3_9EUKA|nr:hypothetical protein BLNAU_13381 [Blattamonas nauphoetae]
MNDVNEQLFELRTTMCTMATQMTEQFGKINERQLEFDSVLRRLDEKRRSDLLRESRFQRWSKTGADAIEIFDEDFIIKTGNTFTLRQRPENEDSNFIPKTLFSPLISSNVAQLSFTITHSYRGYRYGAVSPHLVDTGTLNDIWANEPGLVFWTTYYSAPNVITANTPLPSRSTSEFVLEADCRVGQRTVKCLFDGNVNHDFYVNLPLLFRFAITPLHPSVSVTIHNLSFTDKPTLKGGEREFQFR